MQQIDKLKSSKLVIYDWDGVLALGSNDVIRSLHQSVLAELGVSLDEAEERARLDAAWGNKHQIVNSNLLKERPHLLEAANRLYMRRFVNEYPENVRPVKGGAKLLGRLAVSGYTQALNTASPTKLLVKKVFPKFGIDPAVFNGGMISAYDLDEPAQAKPDPYTIRFLMDQNGFRPDQTVMVGDSGADVLAAYYCGVDVVVPLTGNLDRQTAEEEYEVPPDCVIDNVTHLEQALNCLKLLRLNSTHS